MIIKLLNNLLHKYMWVYERIEGDKGFVLAKSKQDAIRKLSCYYTDTEEALANETMYVYGTDRTEIHEDLDLYVTVPW